MQWRGFCDVRPEHGFAFARISAGDATTADIAVHLGITKQAAAQLVERGYVERRRHPRDARARLLVRTARGRACTTAAEEGGAETIGTWEKQLGPASYRQLAAALDALAEPGRLRPPW